MFTCALQQAQAQDISSPDSTTALVSGKYLSSINKTAGKLEASLDKKTDKLLRKLQQQENRIYKKLQKTDSVKAKQFLEQNQTQYKKTGTGYSETNKKRQYLYTLFRYPDQQFKIPATKPWTPQTKRQCRTTYGCFG